MRFFNLYARYQDFDGSTISSSEVVVEMLNLDFQILLNLNFLKMGFEKKFGSFL